ncbi:MAG: Fur family transcriptional regulator [Kiritimatiellia bacterium]
MANLKQINRITTGGKGLPKSLRRHAVRPTPQRLAILRELAARKIHPDAETIYEQVRQRLPAISLDTVYRNLRLLEARGLIMRVTTVRERARYDADLSPHSHFICSKCSRVLDVPVSALRPVPAEADAFGTVASVHVEFRGLCHQCRTVADGQQGQ